MFEQRYDYHSLNVKKFNVLYSWHSSWLNDTLPVTFYPDGPPVFLREHATVFLFDETFYSCKTFF
jgi:hypothetical protein